jgi:hypothetical protein
LHGIFEPTGCEEFCFLVLQNAPDETVQAVAPGVTKKRLTVRSTPTKWTKLEMKVDIVFSEAEMSDVPLDLAEILPNVLDTPI